MKKIYPVFLLLVAQSAFSQSQVCPLNSNWSQGNLTHWFAYTGNNSQGDNINDRLSLYDSTTGAPRGTIGVQAIQEYALPSVNGIQVTSLPSTDPFGGFPTIPTINRYQYTNSLLLGSTSITRNAGGGTAGGYVRGVSMLISVPPGPTTEPYTMTYAYAMVLENGTHNSNEQPLFSATLEAGDSIVSCASPKYFLPTFNNTNNGITGATLDSALAESEGFKLSLKESPNDDPNGGPGAPHLLDVWYKSWTEVTFDLSPYRGSQVVLTFETDNCVPGGHFAYSYIALRNTFRVMATSGTQRFLSDHGVPAEKVNKVLEGRPHIVDAITNGDIQLVFNTTEGPQALADSRSLRRAALLHKVPYYTTLSGAVAAAQGIRAYLGGDLEVRTLQSYFPKADH